MATKTKHFIVNAICGLIYGRDRRRYVRTVLNADIRRDLRFVRANMTERVRRIRVRAGYMGRNIVIIANDKYAFKFPVIMNGARQKALREKRIVDALRGYSPVHVPSVEILEMSDTRHKQPILVRKYEFVRGTTVRELPAKRVLANINKLAPKMAAAVYAISRATPTEIDDLRQPVATNTTGYMRGWCQGDICDNFMIDPKTMKIIAYIDWEDAQFMDFAHLFRQYKTSPARELMAEVAHEYDKLWRHDNK